MQLIVAPINLITRNYEAETKQPNQPGEYVMYLAVVRSQPDSKL